MAGSFILCIDVLWSVVDSLLTKECPLFLLSLSLSLLFLGAFLFLIIFWRSQAVLKLCKQWVLDADSWLIFHFSPSQMGINRDGQFWFLFIAGALLNHCNKWSAQYSHFCGKIKWASIAPLWVLVSFFFLNLFSVWVFWEHTKCVCLLVTMLHL